MLSFTNHDTRRGTTTGSREGNSLGLFLLLRQVMDTNRCGRDDVQTGITNGSTGSPKKRAPGEPYVMTKLRICGAMKDGAAPRSLYFF